GATALRSKHGHPGFATPAEALHPPRAWRRPGPADRSRRAEWGAAARCARPGPRRLRAMRGDQGSDVRRPGRRRHSGRRVAGRSGVSTPATVNGRHEAIARAWADRAPELAAWAVEHMVNRDDAWGAYYRKADGVHPTTRKATDEVGPQG